MTTRERVWEIDYLDNYCWEDDCWYEFKDGDDVYVKCYSLPDGYAGGCDIYCEKHAPEGSGPPYKAKILPPKRKKM